MASAKWVRLPYYLNPIFESVIFDWLQFFSKKNVQVEPPDLIRLINLPGIAGVLNRAQKEV